MIIKTLDEMYDKYQKDYLSKCLNFGEYIQVMSKLYYIY
jgi:hypothetical protein